MAKKIQLIIGSTREGRIAPQIAEWVQKYTAGHAGIDLEVVDLKEIGLPFFASPVPPKYAPDTTEHGQAWAARVAQADGFIFVTSEYNRSIPASLKNALDYMVTEWKHKPAAIVSYGYTDGGQSATNHLKDILGWLDVQVVEPTVALPLKQDDFADGILKDADKTFAGQVQVLQDALAKLAA